MGKFEERIEQWPGSCINFESIGGRPSCDVGIGTGRLAEVTSSYIDEMREAMVEAVRRVTDPRWISSLFSYDPDGGKRLAGAVGFVECESE
ncbi:MAG: hypothetical protein ABIH78_00450 [Candidatus Peregrinibacteria bacterium]